MDEPDFMAEMREKYPSLEIVGEIPDDENRKMIRKGMMRNRRIVDLSIAYADGIDALLDAQRGTWKSVSSHIFTRE